jgi:rhodanese-related sulfurtransferase
MPDAPLDLPLTTYAAWRGAGTPHALVDCREPWEWQLVHLEGALLAPLGELELHTDDLPRDRPVVVYCHHGVRSRHGALLLRAAGFEAFSLAGGIDAVSRSLDPSLPRY